MAKKAAVTVMVNRNNPLPLYVQVAEYWRERILSGQIAPGEQLPTEGELANLHGVSRITIKQAISSLSHQGLVQTRQGKGTFVIPAKLQWDLGRLSSFTEDMQARHLHPGARLLRRMLVNECPLLEAKDIYFICIERLRLADEEPMALETIWVPHDLCPELMQEDLEGASIYRLFEERFGLKLARADQYLEASTADLKEAELLGIKENSPVLRLERITYLSSGRPCEAAWSVYRGDRYRFKTSLQR